MQASSLDPSNIDILGNIKAVTERVTWVNWKEKVRGKINTLHLLQAKEDAIRKLLKFARIGCWLYNI